MGRKPKSKEDPGEETKKAGPTLDGKRRKEGKKERRRYEVELANFPIPKN